MSLITRGLVDNTLITRGFVNKIITIITGVLSTKRIISILQAFRIIKVAKR